MKPIFVRFLVLSIATSALFISCKKDSESLNKLELMELGDGNFKPSPWGIKGFNQLGAPIIHHPNDFLYEWNEADNTLKSLGSTIPNPSFVAFAKVAQDANGDYFYFSGYQGEVYVLNEVSNQWDIVVIEDGYKTAMVANQKGDILVFVDNTPIGGVASYYKKLAASSNWTKVAERPNDIDPSIFPQFLSNTGLAFFSNTSSYGGADGSGIYGDVVLNTNTGEFETLFDKTDTDNFHATEGYSYQAFATTAISPNGNFYVVQRPVSGIVHSLYQLNTQSLPAKFEKISDLEAVPLEDRYTNIDDYKINEASDIVRLGTSCNFGSYSHKNLAVAKIGSSDINTLQHDGPQNALISSPNGDVFVHNYEGRIYKWE